LIGSLNCKCASIQFQHITSREFVLELDQDEIIEISRKNAQGLVESRLRDEQ
jgi:hypothetical protein